MFLAGPKTKHQETLREDEIRQKDVESFGEQADDDQVAKDSEEALKD